MGDIPFLAKHLSVFSALNMSLSALMERTDFHTCCCLLQNRDNVLFTMGKRTSWTERSNPSFCLEIICKKIAWSREERGLMAHGVWKGSSSSKVLLTAKQSGSEGNSQMLSFPRQRLLADARVCTASCLLSAVVLCSSSSWQGTCELPLVDEGKQNPIQPKILGVKYVG